MGEDGEAGSTVGCMVLGPQELGPFEGRLGKILFWAWDFKPSLGLQSFYGTPE